MRYADLAYEHIKANADDPNRAPTMDRRAHAAGFETTPDYIDDVQSRADTVTFNTSDGRTCWMNDAERVVGWNNQGQPENSTVVPRRTGKDTVDQFEQFHDQAARRDLRLRTHSQKSTVAARAMADRKTVGHRS